MLVNSHTWVLGTPAFLDDYLRLDCHHFYNDVPIICSMLFFKISERKTIVRRSNKKWKRNQIKTFELLAAEAIMLAFECVNAKY